MTSEFAALRLTAVVAVPVRNEAERILDCLQALASQQGLEKDSLGIVLFLNNCTDGTAAAVASLQSGFPVPLRVIDREFAEANAGWARREAMEAAAAWLEESDPASGIILTTDADSRPPFDWVAKNLASIRAGVDAVAGRIVLDEVDAAKLPPALHARGRLEGAYETLLCELEALIDPLPHDPWPRHWTTSGATLAVRLCTYRRVGGMPPLALGEDKAFVSSLLSSDALVRHDPAVVVTTSGRLEGRAPGGAADTMRRRCEDPEAPCDARLEPIHRALARYFWQGRLRRLYAAGKLSRVRLWAPWLGISPSDARRIVALPAFGSVLAAAEAESRRSAYHPLRPADLPVNIKRAQAVLRQLRRLKQVSTAFRAVLPNGSRAVRWPWPPKPVCEK